jgi:hypothetical protein
MWRMLGSLRISRTSVFVTVMLDSYRSRSEE